MPLSLNAGESDILSLGATDASGRTVPNGLAGATIAWAESSDGSVLTLVAATDDLSATVTGVASGHATVSVAATLSDGTSLNANLEVEVADVVTGLVIIANTPTPPATLVTADEAAAFLSAQSSGDAAPADATSAETTAVDTASPDAASADTASTDATTADSTSADSTLITAADQAPLA